MAHVTTNFQKVPLLLFRVLKSSFLENYGCMNFLVKSKCAIISIALFCKRKLKFSGSLSPNLSFLYELSLKKVPSLEIASPTTMSIKRIRMHRDKMTHVTTNFQKVPLLLFRVLKSKEFFRTFLAVLI